MSATTIRVGGEQPYDVVVGHAIAARLPALVGEQARTVVLIHAEGLAELARPALAALAAAGYEVHAEHVPPGEAAKDISVADVMRALDGPLAEVRGLRPEAAHYEGAAVHLQDVWVAVRAAMRNVLERVTLEDVVAGHLPRSVAKLTEDPDAWEPRR